MHCVIASGSAVSKSTAHEDDNMAVETLAAAFNCVALYLTTGTGKWELLWPHSGSDGLVPRGCFGVLAGISLNFQVAVCLCAGLGSDDLLFTVCSLL